MQFWKLHALGNHFVFALHDELLNYPELAQTLCPAGVSVGGDGLLSIDVNSSPPMVRMWNPDGTPDFCGNGLCCAARLLCHLGWRDLAVLQTPIAPVPVSVEEIDAGAARVTVLIRTPDFDPGRIPLSVAHGAFSDQGIEIEVDDRTFRVIPVNNGNIHSVLFVDDLPEDEEFCRYSPQIETHPLFPQKTNVLWCMVGEDKIHLRVWERSCGETLSCGTGAAAAAAICKFAGYALPPSVEVVMRGGSAQVSMSDAGMEFSTRATLVFEGRLTGESWRHASSSPNPADIYVVAPSVPRTAAMGGEAFMSAHKQLR